MRASRRVALNPALSFSLALALLLLLAACGGGGTIALGRLDSIH